VHEQSSSELKPRPPNRSPISAEDHGVICCQQSVTQLKVYFVVHQGEFWILAFRRQQQRPALHTKRTSRATPHTSGLLGLTTTTRAREANCGQRVWAPTPRHLREEQHPHQKLQTMYLNGLESREASRDFERLISHEATEATLLLGDEDTAGFDSTPTRE